MTQAIHATEINEAYAELARAQKDAHAQMEQAVEAKAELDRNLLSGLADGTIDGKNQAMRDACAAQVLKQEFAALDIAEINARAAKLNLDLAHTEVHRIQALLRLAELTS